MSLRPSQSPSPGPADRQERVRQSMGPASRAPLSPRPGASFGTRPASELLGGSGAYQTAEAEALDQWFENLQSYEATLEDMAAASLDVNFKEELSAIEQWFKVLSEAERTAALYSLLQHSTQVQIRFFITVLQQMARSDPMTALLSPAVGGSMQNQMDAKLASLKSPGMMSGFPASPTARSFNTGGGSGNPNRQSLGPSSALDNFLSPDSAANLSGQDAAATLAQQRAKLNAAHRMSAPLLAGTLNSATWGPTVGLGQVAETNTNNSTTPTNDNAPDGTTSRPKSTEFSGSPRPAPVPAVQEATTHTSDSWASMVNTPLIPMFANDQARRDKLALENAANKLNDWNTNKLTPPGVPKMGDPTIHRRPTRSNDGGSRNATNNNNNSNNSSADLVYDDNGNLVAGGQQQFQGQQQYNNNQQQQRPVGGLGTRNVSNSSDNGARWSGSRSPGPSNNNNNNNNNNNRFAGNDELAQMNAMQQQMNAMQLGQLNMNGINSAGVGGFNLPGMGSPGGLGSPMSPFNLNMLSAMGLTPEAQLLAAQMAAASQFGQQGWMGGGPQSAGLNGMPMNMAGLNMMNLNMMNANNRRNGPGSARSPGGGGGLRSASSTGTGRTTDAGGSTPKGEEDVDPALLNDISAWLRSLRLHKYTPNFEGMRWQDMVMMDEDALTAKGVAALGARRKLLKTFEIVRKKMDME